ncbi:MAG: hypothetical protein Q4D26_07645 [Clostridia bacterium]|nr:hypothetical protein [Clostridia bacterium]
MKKLLKTLFLENGELYSIIDNRRTILAHCKPKIEIYEDATNISTIGKGYKVKKKRLSIILCNDLELTREVDENYFHKVIRFELVGDFQRTDGVFERLTFDSLTPMEIDLDGDWSFEIIGESEFIKKLLTL